MTLRTEGVWRLWAGAQAAGGLCPERKRRAGSGGQKGSPEESGLGSNRRVAAWAGELVSRAGARRVKPRPGHPSAAAAAWAELGSVQPGSSRVQCPAPRRQQAPGIVRGLWCIGLYAANSPAAGAGGRDRAQAPGEAQASPSGHVQTRECLKPWLWRSRAQLSPPGKGPDASAGRGWPGPDWSLPGGPDRLRGAKRCPGGLGVQPASALWGGPGVTGFCVKL